MNFLDLTRSSLFISYQYDKDDYSAVAWLYFIYNDWVYDTQENHNDPDGSVDYFDNFCNEDYLCFENISQEFSSIDEFAESLIREHIRCKKEYCYDSEPCLAYDGNYTITIFQNSGEVYHKVFKMLN